MASKAETYSATLKLDEDFHVWMSTKLHADGEEREHKVGIHKMPNCRNLNTSVLHLITSTVSFYGTFLSFTP
jgi:hypothetical protein